uniref:Tropomyosin n=2 Tax=Mycena chlorophos TaxID=658473 RepID=A0ABQ0MBW4_MYCCL|nr:predicted protein [Mycena chlorophos]
MVGHHILSLYFDGEHDGRLGQGADVTGFVANPESLEYISIGLLLRDIHKMFWSPVPDEEPSLLYVGWPLVKCLGYSTTAVRRIELPPYPLPPQLRRLLALQPPVLPHSHPHTHRRAIMTDRVREKLVQLRNDVDNAIARAEDAEGKNKHLTQELLEKENEIKSLTVRLEHAEATLEENDKELKEKTAKVRDLDVRTEQAERAVAAAEAERDKWEAKYEESEKKYRDVKNELAELERQMEGL